MLHDLYVLAQYYKELEMHNFRKELLFQVVACCSKPFMLYSI